MSFQPALIDQARREIRGALYGTKSDTAQKWAKLLGVSYQSMYRLIEDGVKRERTGRPQRPEYYEWSQIIYQLKKRPPEEAGEISTEDALAIAVKGGLIPPDAEGMPVGTIDRIARQQGWTQKAIRANRFQAARPNMAHHFDASTSKFFYIAKRIGDDYLLKIHRPAKHYKNKPVPVDALRPWIYGVTDDHSGRIISRYVAAQGENSADSMSFLAWAWSDLGLPEQLLADQGMLKKALPSRDLIERLGVELPEMMPYQKRGHGKIERPWRTTWQKFELPYFAAADWEKFEITLSELNTHLANYIADKYNAMPHRFEKNITRMQAWSRIALHGGVVKIPENALATVAKRKRRKIGVDGILNYEGNAYEVRGLHEAWVWVFEGIFDDRLVVQDIDTGQKYEVRDFKPLNLGEYKAHTETPHQQLVKASAETAVPREAMLYADAKPVDEKVISMPIRTKEEREIENPFDVTTYASLKEAWSALADIVITPIYGEERRELENLIIANGLDKQFVTDLALELRAALDQRKAAVAGG